ncbi:MAG: ABC transporter permease subunit [Microbacteriaceae bacterium]|nr:ABC transporter permease subunit [Microbacteriaceae bacterium]MCL2794251.1 ABC transporter permease subunit [Microbacteriaceae bacterium]
MTIEERRARIGRRPGFVLPAIYWVVIAVTLVPIVAMIAYSFNIAPNHRITFVWHGFTLAYYLHLTDLSGLWQAFLVSVVIAVLSALISLVIGLPLALALDRYRFRGRSLIWGIVFVDISAPSIVVGAASLSFFLTINLHTGFLTILLVHVAFNVAYVVVTLRSRLSGMGTVLEEAASDLGARPIPAFFTITVPLLMPGIVASFMLALTMSIDDYVITSFVAGSSTTFPLFVYGAKTGMPPQVLCFGTIIFVAGALLALANGALNRKSSF